MTKKKASGGKARPDRIEYEATISPDEAAGYLDTLARGLRAGRVSVGDRAHGFVATVVSGIELEVHAKRGRRRARIDMKLRFASEAQAAPESSNGAEAPATSAVAEQAPEPARELAPQQPAATLPDEMSF